MLVKQLGAGGTGTVFEAVDRVGLRYAIKVLHPELANQRVARKRFQSEAYAANRVGHPNAIAILDDGIEPDGTVYLVMELLEGSSLTQLLGRRADATRGPSLRGSPSACSTYSPRPHARGVVHRDVKPGNIFVAREGKIKLLDFGVARVSDRLGVSIITKPGTTVGTVEFMAPEQAAGRLDQIDALTDVWALGATMFQLLTGRLVHELWTGPSAIIAAATRPAPPVRSVARNVPNGIAHVVDRALRFKRSERWPNARAMRQALLAACPDLIPQGAEPLGAETEPEGRYSERIGELARSFELARSSQRTGYARRQRRRMLVLFLLTVALMALLVGVGVRRPSLAPSHTARSASLSFGALPRPRRTSQYAAAAP